MRHTLHLHYHLYNLKYASMSMFMLLHHEKIYVTLTLAILISPA